MGICFEIEGLVIYLYIFLFKNYEKFSYLLLLFIKMMVETYSWKSPNCEDLQGQMYRFFLICWPYFVVVSWVIKVVFNWFAFNHEIKDLFWARRRMLFVSIPPLSPVSMHHLEHDLKSRTRRFLRWWERKEP